jgi:hypothetical protein
MSTGGSASRQAATPGDGDKSGGNSSGGKSPQAPKLYQPANFMGQSGQPDNQSTNRGKGRT